MRPDEIIFCMNLVRLACLIGAIIFAMRLLRSIFWLMG